MGGIYTFVDCQEACYTFSECVTNTLRGINDNVISYHQEERLPLPNVKGVHIPSSVPVAICTLPPVVVTTDIST